MCSRAGFSHGRVSIQGMYVSMGREERWGQGDSRLQGQPQVADRGRGGCCHKHHGKEIQAPPCPCPCSAEAFGGTSPCCLPASRASVTEAMGSWLESAPWQLEPEEEKLPSAIGLPCRQPAGVLGSSPIPLLLTLPLLCPSRPAAAPTQQCRSCRAALSSPSPSEHFSVWNLTARCVGLGSELALQATS